MNDFISLFYKSSKMNLTLPSKLVGCNENFLWGTLNDESVNTSSFQFKRKYDGGNFHHPSCQCNGNKKKKKNQIKPIKLI